MGLSYTKENGIVTKTFSNIVTDVETEIYALERQLHNIKSSSLNHEGEKFREYSAKEVELITELEQALTLLKE